MAEAVGSLTQQHLLQSKPMNGLFSQRAACAGRGTCCFVRLLRATTSPTRHSESLMSLCRKSWGMIAQPCKRLWLQMQS